MNFIVKGTNTNGLRVTEQVDAVHSRLIHKFPEDYGFKRIKSVKEIKDNNRRKEGRLNKRSESSEY